MQQVVIAAIVFTSLSIAVAKETNNGLHDSINTETWNQQNAHRQLLARKLAKSKKDRTPQNLDRYGIDSAKDVLFYSREDLCNHTTNPEVKDEIRRVCDFIGVTEQCLAPNKTDIERTFEMNCEGMQCNATLSTKQTECALQEAGGDFENDKMQKRCGIPSNYYEVFSELSPIWTISESEDDGLACALALPGGTTLHRRIICVNGEPRFLFVLRWGNAFAPMNATYACVFENQCTDRYSSSICFKLGQDKQVETNENDGESTNGEGDVDTAPQSDEAIDSEAGDASTLADMDENPESTQSSHILTCTMHWMLVITAVSIVLFA